MSGQAEAPQQGTSQAMLRSVAISAAMIAVCSVLLAVALAWRLLDAREQAAAAKAQCGACCGDEPRTQRGETDGRRP